MDPVIKWQKFEEKAPDIKIPAGGINLGVTFEREEEAGNDLEEIKTKTLHLLKVSYDYALPLLRDTVPVNENIIVRFTKSGSHGRDGVEMRVSVEDINSLLVDPGNSRKKLLQESFFVHEIVHNISDRENFTMFLEMIFMIENGQIWRIEDIKNLHLQKRLGVPYDRGLEDISKWLGFPDVISMLTSLPGMDIAKLKEIFVDRLKEYWKEEQKYLKPLPRT